MPESKSGALPLGDIPMSGSGPCIGHTGHCITKSPFWQAFFSKTLRQKALEFSAFLCYNTQHSICGIGISVLCGLPKAKRRVRLPYPAPKIPNANAFGIFTYSLFTLHFSLKRIGDFWNATLRSLRSYCSSVRRGRVLDAPFLQFWRAVRRPAPTVTIFFA